MSCRKRSYRTKRHARHALKIIRARRIHFGDFHIEDHAYRCPHCRKWHLTSRMLAA